MTYDFANMKESRIRFLAKEFDPWWVIMMLIMFLSVVGGALTNVIGVQRNGLSYFLGMTASFVAFTHSNRNRCICFFYVLLILEFLLN